MRTLDAVLLTHPHADAMLGLDDLRQWTLPGFDKNNKLIKESVQSVVDVYLSKDTMQHVQNCFPYLVDMSKASGGGEVAGVNFIIFEEDYEEVGVTFYKPFDLFGVKVEPFEVEHGVFRGKPFMSLGFKFTGTDTDKTIIYVSDVNRIPSIV